MARYMSNISYTETGEWFVKEDDTTVIGLTKDSIEKLSEIVYVEPLIEIGEDVECGEELVAIESVKATATIDAFNNCKIVDINHSIFDDLDTLNNDPEDINSWVIKTTNNI
jgi:glycine cleavage system H lipoate-binding protein